MLRLLQWLIFGHLHTYEVLEKRHFDSRKMDGCKEISRHTGTAYVLRCTSCGRMKIFTPKV